MIEYIQYLVFFIIGIVIGYYMYFHKTIIYHGPNSNKIKKEIYYDKNTKSCYRLIPKVHICPIAYSMNK